MLKRNLKLFILFVIFSFLNFQKSFADILPGSVVQVGKEKYSYVENLQQNQSIVTQNELEPNEYHKTEIFELLKIEEHSDKAVLLELTPEDKNAVSNPDGNAGLLIIGCNQYFQRQNALTKLKPKLLKSVKKRKKKALLILLNAIWVKAEDLKVGEKLVGKDGQTLKVTKVEPFEFNEKQDFYEISLKHHHMYYLLDTAGNHVLTHNIEPFTICALIIGGLIGTIGGGVGGYYYAHKTSKKGTPTKKEVAKDVLIGAGIGAVTGIALSILYVNWSLTGIKSACESALAAIKSHPKISVTIATSASVVIAGGIKYGKDLLKDNPDSDTPKDEEQIEKDF